MLLAPPLLANARRPIAPSIAWDHFMHLKKPSWLKAKTWGEFCTKFQHSDGTFDCAHQECLRKADTVDHIKPRSHPDFVELRDYVDDEGRRRRQANPDGAHVLDNLQPMCRSHNSAKGTRPDAYWSSDLYFDRPLDLDKLRASQRDFIYAVMREAGPQMIGRLNQINGKLLSFFQVTGAGKTLGKFALPFGINHGLLEASSGHRPSRIDRVLIVVKDQSLREQLVKELSTEPVQYGIVDQPPMVREATSSSNLITYSKMAGVHFVVCCTQALWGGEDSAITDANRQQLFNAFPVIVFDEMHFATDRIREVVNQATNSLVFGVTASPINGGGLPLDDMVRCSSYGYRQACANDNSMKSLGKAIDRPEGDGLLPVFDDLIEEVMPEEQQLVSGETITRGESGPGRYSLMSAVNVANALIERLHRLDRIRLTGEVSGHRRLRSSDVDDVVGSLSYWSHAILRAYDIDTAKFLVEYINQKLKSNPDLYPPELGWRAAVAHSQGESLDEKTHPWFWSKNHNGEVSTEAARVLVVKDMACEGINNKLCNVVAWACKPNTMRRVVQANGRAFRSFIKKEGSTLHVPHSHLDRAYILTHFNWGQGESLADRQRPLIDALRFFYNPDSLSGLLSFEDWLANGEEIQEMDFAENDTTVSMYDVLKIVSHLAQCDRTGQRVSLRTIYDMVGCKGGKRQDAVREMAQGLQAGDPQTLRNVHRRYGQFTEATYQGEIAANEKVDVSLSEKMNVDYITSLQNTESLLDKYKDDPEELGRVCSAITPLMRGNYYKAQEMTMQETVTDVCRQVGWKIIHNLQIQTHAGRVYAEVNRAARIIIGVPDEEIFGKDSRFNTPPVILKLKRSPTQGMIVGHVLRTLFEEGFIGEEAYFFRLQDLAAKQMEDEDDDLN